MKTKRIDGRSYNPQEEILELLKRQCPEVFTEGKIDPNKLRLTMGEEVSEEGERYGLSWAGKSDCFRHIQEPTTSTLKPQRKESVDFDNTENIFIEGDNLEVLKVMQKNYYGKVKMIYIDPPYNTGNDSFIYPDRFKEERNGYEERAGIRDEEGLLTKDGFWRKNSKDAGHFHSNWLSMMYPRLFLAKNLLREDGVIFVSIDDNEVQNLRMIMDEIFGEMNFLGCIVWNSTKSVTNTALVSVSHNFNILYAKSIEYFIKNRSHFRFPEEGEGFANPDNDPRGDWKADPFQVGGWRPNQQYEIVNPKTAEVYKPNPGSSWKNDYNKFQELLKDNRIVFGSTGEAGPQRKRFLYEALERGKVSKTWWDDVGTTTNGTQEVKKLFGNKNVYTNPKPVNLLKKMIQLGDHTKKSITLDFFAGSCTTADAVMQLNAEDKGNRKFICVQLAEPCDESEETGKASISLGLQTIADIGKERIRRAAKKIAKENEGKLDFDGGKLDLGFKVFKLDESNFKQWRADIKTGEELKEQMKMFVDNKKKGSAPEDMLYEIILKNSRFDLNVKLEKKTFDGIEYYRLATEGTENSMEIICLADKITKKLAEKILKEKPQKFTCLDTAFKNNDQLKTNTALQMEAEKIEFKVV